MGDPTIIVAIVFGSVILLVSIVAFVIIVIVRSRANRSGGKMTKAEMRLVQEIHSSLSEMEGRIDALETLLLSAGQRR